MKNVLCVFVPGVKGTELWCERCGKRSWPPQFLENPIELSARIVVKGKFSTRVEDTLSADEYECLRSHEKTPTRVIGRVKTAWGLYNREAYSNFLRRLEKTAVQVRRKHGVNVRTVTFPYDWTRSNIESAHRLFDMLVGASGGCDEIVLIAHSMGGLVCRYLLESLLPEEAQREALSSKIVLFYGLGVPHYGCVKSLHNLVDPNGGAFAELCRSLPSVFEMISFSDLDRQIEGLMNDGTVESDKMIRRRSDIFLHDDGEELIFDPKFWRVDGRDDNPYVAEDSDRKTRLIAALVSRFPILENHREDLERAWRFHESLNTGMKPAGCAYVLVNATGVTSPSGIDSSGHLEMRCTKGDGTVCSVVNGERSGGLKDRFRRLTGLGKKINERLAETSEPVYKHNVHLSMLDSVDLITPFAHFVVSNERTGQNAVNALWNIVKTDRRKNERFDRLAVGSFLLGEHAIDSGPFRFKTFNFSVHGRRLCVVFVLLSEDYHSRKEVPVTLVLENITTDKFNKQTNHRVVRITLHLGADRGWSLEGLHVVLPDVYRPVSVIVPAQLPVLGPIRQTTPKHSTMNTERDETDR